MNQEITVGVPKEGVPSIEESMEKAADPSTGRRGTKVTLPEDFLRAPGWEITTIPWETSNWPSCCRMRCSRSR